jgi:hypothetical protein
MLALLLPTLLVLAWIALVVLFALGLAFLVTQTVPMLIDVLEAERRIRERDRAERERKGASK